MENIQQQIEAFLTEDEWPYETLEDDIGLHARYGGENDEWSCYVLVDEEQSLLVFYSVLDVGVPPAMRNTIAEFIARANFGLILGNFEMDFSDGELRYKTSIDLTGIDLPKALIRSLLYTNVVVMDKYLPGIVGVLTDGMTPEAAVTLVEQSD